MENKMSAGGFKLYTLPLPKGKRPIINAKGSSKYRIQAGVER